MNMRHPSNISEEFLRIQDEFLSRETANKNLTSVEDISYHLVKSCCGKETLPLYLQMLL